MITDLIRPFGLLELRAIYNHVVIFGPDSTLIFQLLSGA